MLYYILKYLSLLESVIGFALLSASIMNFKEPIKKRIALGLFLLIFFISIVFYLGLKYGANYVTSFNIFIVFIVSLIWFLICSKDSFIISSFNFLVSVNIYIFISYIVDNMIISSTTIVSIIEYLIMRTIIFGISIPFMFKFIGPRFRILVERLDQEWKLVILMPLTFLILQIILLFYPLPYWDVNRSNWDKLTILIVQILFFIVYYLLYIQANSMVGKYSSPLDSHNNYLFCSNSTANSIFNTYNIKAKKQGIKTEFNICIPENIGIENADLSRILENALENAIEGCLGLAKNVEREIKVTAKFIDKRLRLQVENTSLKDIDSHGDYPITRKNRGRSAIKNIIYIVENYDGTAGFSLIGGRFITQIVLNSK